jgi:2-polyprenyl-3-methyl-5-hydroxy-6-metoxy-1,4-benzoquinol methylase
MGSTAPNLLRELSFADVVIAGIGTIIGAGIFAVLGVAAARAGNAIWISFCIAGIAAAFTALSYAEFASMFPRAGAEFDYISEAFGRKPGFISGLLILIVLIALFIIIALAWRFASRRYTIPCPVWMKGLLDTPFSGAMSARTQKTIQLLGPGPGMNVLDAGCGPGRLTVPLARAVGPKGEVTAIDIQEGMLDEAKKRAQVAGLTNIRFLRTGIGEGRLERDRFDRVVLVTVLGEIPDRDAAFREIFDALRPGGILLVEETIRDPHFQTRSTVRRLAGASGFVEKEFFGNYFSYTLTFTKPSTA